MYDFITAIADNKNKVNYHMPHCIAYLPTTIILLFFSDCGILSAGKIRLLA